MMVMNIAGLDFSVSQWPIHTLQVLLIMCLRLSIGGQIPNKQLIADAKKRREEARKAGDEDFIPLDDVDRFVDSKSRLIR